ncbi:MAG: thiamine pyrophosphate-binding protein [Bacteroidales bacterium]|nr:thiamine pyrophosphate-binding protein [Bacteroidales bacterium]
MKLSDYIAERLYEAGVRFVYGIPGSASIPYIESFSRHGIRFILVSHESAAGIMASVTGRITGIPGICHATMGPGAANILTGAGFALLDRAPVVILTSETDERMLGRTSQMNVDHQGLFSPVTKATYRVNKNNAENVLNTALKICTHEYPGPVHIGLPAGIAEEEIETGSEAGILSGNELLTDSQIVENRDTEKIINLLEQSRRPLIAVGLTAARHKISSSLREFLVLRKIPVVLTPMAKSLLPENHPSYTGVLFHALSDYLTDVFEKTDLVIGLGYDPVEFNYESWMPDVPLVHFNSVITDLPEKREVFQYTGTPDEWFSLMSHLNPGQIVSESGLIKGIRDETEAVFEGFTNHFGPVSAVKILQEELPAGATVTADVGSHLHLLGQYWKTGGADNFIITNGWSGMGFGIPSALAIQLLKPWADVVCITGDGGLLMSAGEIMTARRYSLPVKIVVLSDGELNLIKIKQLWQNIPPEGTLLYSGDLFNADSFLGVRVIRAGSHEEMSNAINKAFSVNEPVIINAVIDPEDYSWLVVKR